MPRLSTVLVAILAVGLAGCQRQTAPEKTAPDAEAAEQGGAAAPEAPAAEMPEEPRAASTRPAEGPTARSSRDSQPSTRARGDEAPARSPAAPRAESSTPALSSNPTPEPRILSAGTTLPLVLESPVASNTSRVGDRVVASLAEDVSAGGRVLLTAGTEVIGRVTAAVQSGRVKGRARLAVEFNEVRDGGSSYRIDATPIDITADSSKGKDAKIAGGAAAAGAIIGAIAGGGKGALKGGAIGGAAGGAAVLATRGDEVVLDAGTRIDVTLERRAQID